MPGREDDGWHPIETAPKTTPPTIILVCGGDLQRPAIVYWSWQQECWIMDGARGQTSYEFKYWRPVPEPPREEDDDDAGS